MGNDRKRIRPPQQALLNLLVRSKRLDPERARTVENSLAAGGNDLVDSLQRGAGIDDKDLARFVAEGLRLPLLQLSSAPFDEGSGSNGTSIRSSDGSTPTSAR